MILNIIAKFKDYCDRNERAHKSTKLMITEEEMQQLEKLPKLPTDTANRIKNEETKELYILEIHNNDITPVSIVVELIKTYCLKTESFAYEIAMNIHNKGKSQVMAGNEETLLEVAELIEESAVKLKYPLKCNVCKA